MNLVHNVRDNIMGWRPFEAHVQQPPPEQMTFFKRMAQSFSPFTRAGEQLRENAMAAASQAKEKTMEAFENVKEKVSDIHLRPTPAPQWASLLGLSFWWAPGVLSTLLNCGLITAFVQAVGWAIHSGMDIVAHYDAFGVLNIVGLALYSYAIQPNVGLRQLLLTACVAIWGVRLAAFLMDRFKDEGVDRALAKVRTPRARALLWALQAVWVFITALPVMLANAEGGKQTTYWGPPMSFKSLCARDFVGFGMWIIGFLYETIADWEKAQFRKRPLKEGDKPFINTGLWKYSRHPNYFGEILMWSGIYIAASTVLHSWQHLAVLSPVLMAFTLRYISGVPRVEAQADRAFGNNPSYQDYKKRTPLIVPFL